jgi:hypothetical protein
LAQSVCAVQRLRRSSANALTAVFCFWETSVDLIAVVACASVCWLAGVDFRTSKTY